MVYIVDDTLDYQYLLKKVFSLYLPQHSVQFFANGEELHQHLLTGSELPQLILLDLDMPVLNGYQTLTLLKQHLHWRHIPIIIMSNSITSQEISACYEAFANSFLVKPSDFEQMKRQIELICAYWLGLNKNVYSKPVAVLCRLSHTGFYSTQFYGKARHCGCWKFGGRNRSPEGIGVPITLRL